MLRRCRATSLLFAATLLGSARAADVGRPAPDFSLPDAQGKALSRPTTQPYGCSVKYP